MKLRLLLIFTVFSLLVSCGKNNSSRRSHKFINSLSPEQMNLIIQNQQIWCADQDCPEGVGRMFSITTEFRRPSMSCSAFLIKEDLVITNSHCIYVGEVSDPETCERLYFAFPDSRGISHSARCAEILWRDRRHHGSTSYRRGDIDIALVRLQQPPGVAPLKLLKGAIRNGSRVYPRVVDQINAYQARMVKLECSVSEVNHRYGVATLENCPIISGNSGSPVLDQHKRVLGLIFASSDADIKSPTDPLESRKVAPVRGYAFTSDYLERILGRILTEAGSL